MKYAEGTSVPIERSRAEIERLATRYGATQFSSGWSNGLAAIGFVSANRGVRFELPLANKADVPAKLARDWGSKSADSRTADWVDQENRRRWRALLLAIKAKLESVESGIETFEQAFFANLVTRDGATLYHRFMGDAAMAGKLLPAVKE